MKHDYQIGSDVEWLKHSNEEMARLVKKRQRQLWLWKFLAFVLLIALGWVVFKYMHKYPLSDLWRV